MCVYENRRRRAAPPDFFQNFAVGHLRKSMPAILLRGGHTEHANAAQAVDHAARNVCLPIDLCSIEISIEKFAQLRERLIELTLFRRLNARIRHHPIRYEMALEKAFREPKRLWPREKQFLRLLNLFLSLRVDFVHSVELSKKWRRTVAVRARVSNQAQQLRLNNPSVRNLKI
jgi:hypothetical protein